MLRFGETLAVVRFVPAPGSKRELTPEEKIELSQQALTKAGREATARFIYDPQTDVVLCLDKADAQDYLRELREQLGGSPLTEDILLRTKDLSLTATVVTRDGAEAAAKQIVNRLIRMLFSQKTALMGLTYRGTTAETLEPVSIQPLALDFNRFFTEA